MTTRISWLVLAAALGCSATTEVEVPDAVPPGPDVTEPFPIDRGDDGVHTPGSFKGLWLRLADTGAPTVTAVDGVIGVVCVGMSNASQECDAFIELVSGAGAVEVNPAVRIVNCAVGGHAIERWIDPAYDDRLWDDCVTRKLPQAGVRLDQVRVIYHKAANQFTAGAGGIPLPLYPHDGSDYENFLANLALFASRVPDEFPAVEAVYTSSRSYGGYANSARRGEPLSYEEGHALNTWLEENPAVEAVWYGWGAYLWAPDCADGFNGGGLCYVRGDYVDDGVHPSSSGRAKIALAMHERLRQESWYRR